MKLHKRCVNYQVLRSSENRVVSEYGFDEQPGCTLSVLSNPQRDVLLHELKILVNDFYNKRDGLSLISKFFVLLAITGIAVTMAEDFYAKAI